MAASREPCQLTLAIEAADNAVERLGAVIAAERIACVVIEPAADRVLEAQVARPLVEIAQKAGVAALISGDAALARTLRADGVHIGVSDQPAESWRAARDILGGRAIVGADAGRSRHDAMTLGELGADYVAFGVPAAVKERQTAFRRQYELIGWWADIFEPPCMAADVESIEAAEALVAAGADFISLRLAGGLSVGDAVAEAHAWQEMIARTGRDAVKSRGGDEQ